MMVPKFLVQFQKFLPQYSDREGTVVHGRGAGLGTSSAALSAQVNVVHTVPDFPVNGYKSLFLQLNLHINDFFCVGEKKNPKVKQKDENYCLQVQKYVGK